MRIVKHTRLLVIVAILISLLSATAATTQQSDVEKRIDPFLNITLLGWRSASGKQRGQNGDY